MHKYEEQIVHPELDKPTEVEKVLTVDALAKAIGRPLELSHAGEIGALIADMVYFLHWILKIIPSHMQLNGLVIVKKRRERLIYYMKLLTAA